ncbi:nucleoside deaminase [Serratia rubidaea]|nr:nucleoside deaminase [Serratia rubidaea]
MTLLSGLSLTFPSLAKEKLPSLVVLSGHNLTLKERQRDEYFMKKAIKQAIKNPMHPFGCVIVDLDAKTVLSEGVNTASMNPILHAEIVAINNYICKHGNQGWEKLTIYTTGEPCPMCMSAIVWAGIPRVVWASSIQTIRASGIGQIDIAASEVAASARELHHPQSLIQGILSDKTDLMFLKRRNSKLSDK